MSRIKELLAKLAKLNPIGRIGNKKAAGDAAHADSSEEFAAGGPGSAHATDDPGSVLAAGPSAPKAKKAKKKRRRLVLPVKVKNLDRTNSFTGKLLDPFADPTCRLRLPGPIARMIGKGRGMPLFGKRIGRISDEGLRYPHIFHRELRLPRPLSKLLLLGAKAPLIGKRLTRLAGWSAYTPDLRNGLFRLKLGLWTGAITIIIIFVAVIQFPLTTNPMFCGSCHTMRPQFYNWKYSSHSRVTCYACHVSPGLWWLTRDHLVDGPMGIFFEVEIGLAGFRWDDSTALNSTSHAGQTGIKSSRCLRCHDMATRPVTATKGLKIDHMAHLRRNIACTWCHNRVTHWRVANHENFMTGQACFRCHYLPPEQAKLGNGAPLPTDEQLALGLGLPYEGGEHAAEGGHGEEEGGHGGEHGEAGEHGAAGEHPPEPTRYQTEDTAGEIVTPEEAKEKGLTGSFVEGALAQSRGHGNIDEEIRQAYHPKTPVSLAIKEAALAAPIIGIPQVHIDYSKFAASGACSVCHMRGKL